MSNNLPKEEADGNLVWKDRALKAEAELASLFWLFFGLILISCTIIAIFALTPYLYPDFCANCTVGGMRP